MSRNLFPVVMAIGVGVFTGTGQFSPLVIDWFGTNFIFYSAGYYTFQPTFQQLAAERAPATQPYPPAASSLKSAEAPTGDAPPNAAKPEAEKKQ